MVVSSVMYFMFALSGLIGGAIAWEDLRTPKGKNNQKAATETK